MTAALHVGSSDVADAVADSPIASRRSAGLQLERDAVIPLVARHRAAVAALCSRDGVRWLDHFGSAADGRVDDATSDLDFVADFADPLVPGFARRYLAFAETLETLPGRPVDVVTERAIETPGFRAPVDASRQPVYDEPDSAMVAERGDNASGERRTI